MPSSTASTTTKTTTNSPAMTEAKFRADAAAVRDTTRLLVHTLDRIDCSGDAWDLLSRTEQDTLPSLRSQVFGLWEEAALFTAANGDQPNGVQKIRDLHASARKLKSTTTTTSALLKLALDGTLTDSVKLATAKNGMEHSALASVLGQFEERRRAPRWEYDPERDGVYFGARTTVHGKKDAESVSQAMPAGVVGILRLVAECGAALGDIKAFIRCYLALLGAVEKSADGLVAGPHMRIICAGYLRLLSDSLGHPHAAVRTILRNTTLLATILPRLGTVAYPVNSMYYAGNSVYSVDGIMYHAGSSVPLKPWQTQKLLVHSVHETAAAAEAPRTHDLFTEKWMDAFFANGVPASSDESSRGGAATLLRAIWQGAEKEELSHIKQRAYEVHPSTEQDHVISSTVEYVNSVLQQVASSRGSLLIDTTFIGDISPVVPSAFVSVSGARFETPIVLRPILAPPIIQANTFDIKMYGMTA